MNKLIYIDGWEGLAVSGLPNTLQCLKQLNTDILSCILYRFTLFICIYIVTLPRGSENRKALESMNTKSMCSLHNLFQLKQNIQ